MSVTLILGILVFGLRTVADLLGGRGRGVAFDDDPQSTFARERGVPETNVDHAA